MMNVLEEDIDVSYGERLANEPIGIDSLKNERNLMLFPFCSTSKALRFKSIKYTSKDNKFSLEVTANNEYGMAKIWDFDILRFVFSKIDTIAGRTGHYPSAVSFSAYECLKFLKRNPNAGKNIQWLKEALDRLTSTTYKGNIFKDEGKHVTGFTLIRYEYIESSRGIEKISIALDERLVFSLRNSKSLITISDRLLEETSGLKKRLLELVYLKLSNDTWIVPVDELQCLCANSWAIAKFKNEIKSFNDLPWSISEVKTGDQACFRFITK
jgi:plasmid replication initiation protein